MIKYSAYILSVILFCNVITAQDCKAVLSIKSENPESSIFINSKLVGKGNAELEVEKGKHTIIIRENIYRWSGNDFERVIDINDCSKLYNVTFLKSNKIFVDTKPQNASIIKNDSLIGYSPQFVEVIPKDKLEFKKGNRITSVSYNELKNNSPVPIDFVENNKSEGFSDSPLFKILVGSAAVLGATAAYFKLKADNKYDDYLFTKDRSTLNEVDRLDLYSGISFGLLQINFGFLIYKFLTD